MHKQVLSAGGNRKVQMKYTLLILSQEIDFFFVTSIYCSFMVNLFLPAVTKTCSLDVIV